MTNLLSMERDWVPTIANPPVEGMARTKFDLTHLNTVMKRIDMLCKFLAPTAVATFISTVATVKIAVVVIAIFSMLGWGIECWTVKKVWNQNRRLREPKENDEGCISSDRPGEERSGTNSKWASVPPLLEPGLPRRFFFYAKESFYPHWESIRYFFSSAVWIPSLCLALLHASVLSWSATLFTYLLNAGFSLGLITVARAIGSLFEIGSTFVFPWLVRVLSGSRDIASPYVSVSLPFRDADEDPDAPLASNTEREHPADGTTNEQEQAFQNLNTGVVRAGRWGICGLFITLVCGLQLHGQPPMIK